MMPGTFAIYMEGCPQILPADFLKNNWNKFCRFGKKCYLCTPKWKTGHSKEWKDTTSSLKRLIFILYKKQVPRNTIYREALISFEIREVSGQAKRYKRLYNEEFDPGSGWTLAAGLTHASRGAAWRNLRVSLMATGARVRNAWATCPYQGDNRWKRRLIPHSIGFRHL